VDLVQPPLADLHRASGARLGAFAGWEMPIQFGGTIAEHEAVRAAVGVFDVSHLGTVWVTGPGAAATIDGSFTNDPSLLADGRSQYTLCATEDGGVVDDLIVYRLGAERWLVVPNGANTRAVVDRLVSQAGGDVDVDDESTGWAVLAVQGPASFPLVAEVTGVDPAGLAFGDVAELDSGAVLCRTGYTGERGVELVVPAVAAADVWRALVDGGAVPCGLAARDTLRLEMGYPLHGNELSREISPYEARSGWAVKLADRHFVGSEALSAARAAGPARRMWGLVADGRRPPRAGMAVSRGGAPVGAVTSGSFSPTRGVGIGLALLDAAVQDGEQVTVDVRGTDVAYTVVRPPLVDRSPH
jgi:aminomethyltransferase